MSDLLSDISFILPGHGPENVFPSQPDLQLVAGFLSAGICIQVAAGKGFRRYERTGQCAVLLLTNLSLLTTGCRFSESMGRVAV
jgi:hypothetical protein